MNKKQRNRKTLNQNLRNRLINRRYKSSIKTLMKNIKKIIKEINKEENQALKTEKGMNLEKLKNKIFSFIDKAAKKKIFHKNKAARKKSRLIALLKKP